MQQVSDAWRAETQRPVAGEAAVRVRFFMTDVTAAPDAAFAPQSAQALWSACESAAAEDAVPARPYATFELGRFLADGGGSVLPDDATQWLAEGFVSQTLSDAAGAYPLTAQPRVRINFGAQHTVAALTLVFDVAANDWPTRLRLCAWRAGTLLCDETYTPTAAEFLTSTPIEKFDALELTWIQSAKPFRRARLQQILFGAAHLFTGTGLVKTVQSMEVDPVTRRLPQNTLAFTIVNENPLTGDGGCRYDPDNAAGVWHYIEQRSPVHLTYGQTLPRENRTEWLDGGRYYLTAQPAVSSLYADFKAQDLLATLTGTYTRGVYAAAGRTLLELAQDVLADAKIPRVHANDVAWRLWDGLALVSTTAPLPVKKHKECLQLIAHAARCVLYTDRAGRIRIEPAGGGAAGDTAAVEQNGAGAVGVALLAASAAEDSTAGSAVGNAPGNAVQSDVGSAASIVQNTAVSAAQTAVSAATQIAASAATQTAASAATQTVPPAAAQIAASAVPTAVPHIGLDAMMALPKCEKIAPLAAVSCKCYTYAPAEAVTKLHAGTYAVEGTRTLRLTYAQAAEISAVVTGEGVSILQAAYYATSADITLTGTGTAALTVSGKTLQTSAAQLTVVAENAPEGGQIELLDNPLITTAETALAVAAWVRDYLLLRTTYTCVTRGAPELDAIDCVTADSRFATAFPARVVKTQTTYSGGLSGALTLKRMVKH